MIPVNVSVFSAPMPFLVVSVLALGSSAPPETAGETKRAEWSHLPVHTAKRVRYYKVGKFVRLRPADLDAFVDAGRQNPVEVRVHARSPLDRRGRRYSTQEVWSPSLVRPRLRAVRHEAHPPRPLAGKHPRSWCDPPLDSMSRCGFSTRLAVCCLRPTTTCPVQPWSSSPKSPRSRTQSQCRSCGGSFARRSEALGEREHSVLADVYRRLEDTDLSAAVLGRLVASGDETARQELLRRAESGDLDALGELGDVRLLSGKAASRLIQTDDRRVRDVVRSSHEGVYGMGGHDPLRGLAVLNLWFPEAASWETLLNALEDEAVAARDKAGACAVLPPARAVYLTGWRSKYAACWDVFPLRKRGGYPARRNLWRVSRASWRLPWRMTMMRRSPASRREDRSNGRASRTHWLRLRVATHRQFSRSSPATRT